jgi:PII-like signaling protein
VSGAAREALELRFYFGERDRDGDGPLDAAVMDACERSGVWAAALLRGVEGFGRKARIRTERLLSLSEDAPLVAIAVGERDAVARLAADVRAVASEGLLTIAEVEATGLATTGTPTTTADEVGVPVVGTPGDGGRDVVRATIWGPRSGAGSPHLRAVDALHRHGADSGVVLLGVDGVLGGERRRARFVAANRGVPAITVAVGERGAILAALAELDAAPDLVTVEGVEPFCRMEKGKLHGGASVERNRPNEAERLHGAGGVERSSRIAGGRLHGARVTLLTSEATQGAEGAVYLEFVRALRRGGAAGATALRGVWGFRGDVPPHGDRVLALRRDVPVLVEVVDSEERCAEWLGIAEGLAGGADAVDSQGGIGIFTLD